MVRQKQAGNRRRSRTERSPGPIPRLRVTARDLSMLQALSEYGLLSTSQIQRLFFISVCRARKRLFLLWQHGLVQRRFRPIIIGKGTSEILYTLSRKGVRILETSDLLNDKDGLGNVSISPTVSGNIEHAIALNDFHISTISACHSLPEVSLLDWKQGARILRTVMVPDPSQSQELSRVPLIADADFRLRTPFGELTYLTEIDMGTISHPRLFRKLRAYHKLWLDSQLGMIDGQCPFKLLIVTTGEERAGRIICLIRKHLPTNINRGPFWIANQKMVRDTKNVLFDPIWRSPLRSDDQLERLLV